MPGLSKLILVTFVNNFGVFVMFLLSSRRYQGSLTWSLSGVPSRVQPHSLSLGLNTYFFSYFPILCLMFSSIPRNSAPYVGCRWFPPRYQSCHLGGRSGGMSATVATGAMMNYMI